MNVCSMGSMGVKGARGGTFVKNRIYIFIVDEGPHTHTHVCIYPRRVGGESERERERERRGRLKESE